MRKSTEVWPGMGERIGQRLRELGYRSVEDFTQRRRYSLGLFYKWMREQAAPRRANIVRLALDLDVSLRWLMFGNATHVEGVPVDVLMAGLPADVQPETMDEKRRFMERAFKTPRRGKPGAGGSAASASLPVAEPNTAAQSDCALSALGRKPAAKMWGRVDSSTTRRRAA